jgi:hypothetical protein
MVEQSSKNPTCLHSSHVACMACKDTNRRIKPYAELSTSVLGRPFSSYGACILLDVASLCINLMQVTNNISQ